MALKAGRRGPRFDARWLRADYRPHGWRTACGRRVDGRGAGFAALPCATNSRFRTGADKGNPTV
jgi:hypothetical protein